MPIGSIDINSNPNLLLSIGAAITGAVFGEMTLRSWRELTEVILSRGGAQGEQAPQPEIDHKSSPTTEMRIPGPGSVGNPRGIIRFLILKGATIAVPVLFFVATRPAFGNQQLLIFLAVYLVYLFLRGWGLQRKVR